MTYNVFGGTSNPIQSINPLMSFLLTLLSKLCLDIFTW